MAEVTDQQLSEDDQNIPTTDSENADVPLEVATEIENNTEIILTILNGILTSEETTQDEAEENTKSDISAQEIILKLLGLNEDQRQIVLNKLNDQNQCTITLEWLQCKGADILINDETPAMDTPIDEPEETPTVPVNQTIDSRPQSQLTDVLDSSPRPYANVIQESAGTMIDCLLPSNELLVHLYKHSVLSADMVTKIMCRPNRPNKVKVLLKFLMTLGPQSLESFVNALHATDQHFLANILSIYEVV